MTFRFRFQVFFLSILILITSVYPPQLSKSEIEKLGRQTIDVGNSDLSDLAISQNKIFVANGAEGFAVFSLLNNKLILLQTVFLEKFSDYSAIEVSDKFIYLYDFEQREILLLSVTSFEILDRINISFLSSFRGLLAIDQNLVLAYGNGFSLLSVINDRFAPLIQNSSLSVYDAFTLNSQVFLLSDLGLVIINTSDLTYDVYPTSQFELGAKFFFTDKTLYAFSGKSLFIVDNSSASYVKLMEFMPRYIFALPNKTFAITSSDVLLLDRDFTVFQNVSGMWGIDRIKDIATVDGKIIVAHGVSGLEVFLPQDSKSLRLFSSFDFPSNNFQLVSSSENGVVASVSEYDSIVFFSIDDLTVFRFPFPYQINDIVILGSYLIAVNDTGLFVFDIRNLQNILLVYTNPALNGSSLSLFKNWIAVANSDWISLLDFSTPVSPQLLSTYQINGVDAILLTDKKLFYATTSSIGEINILQTKLVSATEIKLGFEFSEVNDLTLTNDMILLTGFPYLLVTTDVPLQKSNEVMKTSGIDVGRNLFPLSNESILLVSVSYLMEIKVPSLVNVSYYPIEQTYDSTIISGKNKIITASGDLGLNIYGFLILADSSPFISPLDYLIFIIISVPVLMAIILIGWLIKKFSRQRAHKSIDIQNLENYFEHD